MSRLKDALQQQRDEFLATANRYHAVNVRLFGSVARGDAAEKSDIDLLDTEWTVVETALDDTFTVNIVIACDQSSRSAITANHTVCFGRIGIVGLAVCSILAQLFIFTPFSFTYEQFILIGWW